MFELPFNYLLTITVWLCCLPVMFVLLLKFRRWCKRRGKKLRFANFCLSVFMFLAGLTAVELYFSVIYDQSDSFNMSLVSKKWFARWVRQKPLVFPNGHGLPYRDNIDFPTKPLPDGKQHICFIGDSFTFGHGIRHVENRFSNLVRDRLEIRDPGTFVVTNIADAGKDLHWVSDVADELIESGYPVQTLVYVLCLNDIETFDPKHRDQPVAGGVQRPSFDLFSESYFLNLLYFRTMQATLPGVRNYYSHVQDSYQGLAFSRMFGHLVLMRDSLREANIELRVVVFPFLHNLGPDYPFKPAHENILKSCEREKIPCLDLFPVLLPHAGENLTVNIFDAHPNERAHAYAADAIERDLWLSREKPSETGGEKMTSGKETK